MLGITSSIIPMMQGNVCRSVPALELGQKSAINQLFMIACMWLSGLSFCDCA